VETHCTCACHWQRQRQAPARPWCAMLRVWYVEGEVLAWMVVSRLHFAKSHLFTFSTSLIACAANIKCTLALGTDDVIGGDAPPPPLLRIYILLSSNTSLSIKASPSGILILVDTATIGFGGTKSTSRSNHIRCTRTIVESGTPRSPYFRVRGLIISASLHPIRGCQVRFLYQMSLSHPVV
jgi:hypothetical protein